MAASSSAVSQSPTANDFTLQVTTREIVVDVVATESGRFVENLKNSDFQVFELGEHGSQEPQAIVAVYLLGADTVQDENPSPTLHAVLGGSCAETHMRHYQVVYRVSADRQGSGMHELLVTTNHNGIKLTFGHSYYVGNTDPSSAAAKLSAAKAEQALLEAACFHPLTPLSLALSAQPAQAAANGDPQYVIKIQPRSSELISLSTSRLTTQLQYGVCTFAANGSYLLFNTTHTDVELQAGGFARLRQSGLSTELNVPRQGHPVFARFVVRDAGTGNMGSVDVSVSAPPPSLSEAMRSGTPTFGTITPLPGSMCGDVYELERGEPKLPEFRTLSSVGSLHTYTFNSPRQAWMHGIPGATREFGYFGIDYFGTFWINVPGEYTFELGADDGANLYIDDKKVIDNDGIHEMRFVSGDVKLERGRHTLHLPYYQAEPFEVGLQLFVKAPGGTFQPFDVREYAAPAEPPAR